MNIDSCCLGMLIFNEDVGGWSTVSRHPYNISKQEASTIENNYSTANAFSLSRVQFWVWGGKETDLAREHKSIWN